MHYCFYCGQPRKLNPQAMCAPCMTLWLSSTPAERRTLIHLIRPKLVASPDVQRPEMQPGW